MNAWIATGAAAGFLSVVLGAFGAHGLRARLAPDLLVIFETGARYQMYHALALVLVGLLADRLAPGPVRVAGIGFTLGILIFSGSLYALALTGIRGLGAITPLGGVAFLVGWAALLAAAFGKGK